MSRRIYFGGVRIQTDAGFLLEIKSPNTSNLSDAPWTSHSDNNDNKQLAAHHLARNAQCNPESISFLPARVPTHEALTIHLDATNNRLFRAIVEVNEGSRWLIRTTHPLKIPGIGSILELLTSTPSTYLYHWMPQHVVGEARLLCANILLPVLVMDRKMPRLSDGNPIALLEQFLFEVWRRHAGLLWRPNNATTSSTAQGQEAPRSPIQTLMLLDHLLHHERLSDAWDALPSMAHSALTAEYPKRPTALARAPVLHGPRAPWLISQNHPPDHLPTVHDRRPTRTLDTPPNRLALRLALLVEHIAQKIVSLLDANAHTIQDQTTAVAWSELAHNIRKRACHVRSLPLFRDVQPWQNIPLESPQIQRHPLYQPMLRAWTALHEGIAWPESAEPLFQDPLKRIHELYEYWCWFALCDALETIAQTILQNTSLQSDDPLHNQTSLRYALKRTIHLNDRTRAVLRYNHTTFAGGHLERNSIISYSRTFRPDLCLELQDSQTHAMHTLILFDAKYRIERLGYDEKTQSKKSDLEKIHAYRDAIRWGQARKHPLWVIALYPGETEMVYGESGGHGWSDKQGGVGALPLYPGHTEKLVDVLRELLEEKHHAKQC